MTEHNVQPHRVTKPIQLLAAWLVGLFIVDGLFLTTANLMPKPEWLAPLLVIAAVLNVPLFLICIFLLQTKFRPEMQEDSFYSEYIQTQITSDQAIESQLELAQTKDKLASLEENYKKTLETLNIESSQRAELEEDYEKLKRTNQAVATEAVFHDLQTRLQAVIAHSENLAVKAEDRSALKAEIARDATRVLHSAVALSSTLSNYRYAEQEEPSLSRIDLWELLQESIATYKESAHKRGLSIELRLEPVHGVPPEILSSPHQLQLVFNNLIDNAIRYSFVSSNQIPIPIRILGHKSDQYYEIQIENTGLGFSTDERELLFDRGYRGRQSLSEYPSRPGFGLHISRQIMRKHGGDLTIESFPVGDNESINAFLTRATIKLPHQSHEPKIYG